MRLRYRGPVTPDDPVPPVLWAPPADARDRSRMGRYLAWLERERGLVLDDYDAAWRWSVDEPGAFWQSVWDHFEVRVVHAARTGPDPPSPTPACPARAGSRAPR